jgi:peroxiredoxin Q/BCP
MDYIGVKMWQRCDMDRARDLPNRRLGLESARAQTMLQPGQHAPEFSLPDADMQPVSLASFQGKKHVVLYFYPRDNTPTCTQEAAEFSDHEHEFGRASCVILGVSRDDCLTHQAFRDQHGLSIPLLSDTDGEVCRRYGVLQEKESDGVKRLCVVRSTFVIDKKGVLRHVAYGVNPKHHAAEIFAVVKKLKS